MFRWAARRSFSLDRESTFDKEKKLGSEEGSSATTPGGGMPRRHKRRLTSPIFTDLVQQRRRSSGGGGHKSRLTSNGGPQIRRQSAIMGIGHEEDDLMAYVTDGSADPEMVKHRTLKAQAILIAQHQSHLLHLATELIWLENMLQKERGDVKRVLERKEQTIHQQHRVIYRLLTQLREQSVRKEEHVDSDEGAVAVTGVPASSSETPQAADDDSAVVLEDSPATSTHGGSDTQEKAPAQSSTPRVMRSVSDVLNHSLNQLRTSTGLQDEVERAAQDALQCACVAEITRSLCSKGKRPRRGSLKKNPAHPYNHYMRNPDVMETVYSVEEDGSLDKPDGPDLRRQYWRARDSSSSEKSKSLGDDGTGSVQTQPMPITHVPLSPTSSTPQLGISRKQNPLVPQYQSSLAAPAPSGSGLLGKLRRSRWFGSCDNVNLAQMNYTPVTPRDEATEQEHAPRLYRYTRRTTESPFFSPRSHKLSHQLSVGPLGSSANTVREFDMNASCPDIRRELLVTRRRVVGKAMAVEPDEVDEDDEVLSSEDYHGMNEEQHRPVIKERMGVLNTHRNVTKPKDIKNKKLLKSKSTSLEELRFRFQNWMGLHRRDKVLTAKRN
ncbi:unnamed protein product [Cyprideis torosa]|uniref:Uncharacterized protein n=1 Tax=Cyprideis torosa TaxID=163714 RepID=A0A7R8WCE1_9CRUS|nr:unnamed protein product [Cyprideis torosa]CAG0893337.1 unnamed protein product [Cyprideis torosa]